ncbi:pentatricopeptide repeat-containing protein At5g48730, chloroplastic-like [Salvia splendens]|uniref:pentatricopeptide repeat-containing protein At5g48730, chloroplastic-like n=1 Tax=Salvia splendens TaxID=180675 RepID=UPI0011023F53|nr:pentatricopeptide repeat-containing protein At5g48730, chloroplastic-like [Salvia splendens]XP_042068015.1 pentatricopeptide repeat-containing protein At5g48730, chloroplastic-like [Salvia splendens]XP_042068016.1 pentatricopeptide repeat-containing protein At5g48730, chloroplastic-like [Salvia splendens]XP_042068017.1 pentatricopeptide repeat-containing protein At5g48730, chloroplastic-like [Salvia splendens]
MASLPGPTNPFPPSFSRPNHARTRINITMKPDPQPPNAGGNMVTTAERRLGQAKMKEVENRERKEQTNRKIASKKAISIILRREATKAVIEKKKGGSKRLLPKSVLDALHERITALRWESALKVFELLREQVWYKPYAGIYVKLITMLGKCKQPEIAHTLFQAMIDEGCVADREAYTALMSAYSRSGLFDRAYSILDQMKKIPDCQPDVYTYSILIKSCLHVYDFDAVNSLLSEMEVHGIRPSTVTYNTLIDAYGKAKKFVEMESVLVQMLRQPHCEPDVWTMNSTLRAFGGSGQIDMMEKCYDKFLKAGIDPTIKTFNILLDAYGKTENYEKMSAVMQYMQRYHYTWTLVTYNIVIDAFGRGGDVKQMEFLFRLMQSERIKPNCVTLCSLVRAYGNAGKLEKIAAVLRFVENSDVTLDTVFFNCLINAYGLMGCIAEMKGVTEMMKRRGCKLDKVTYRTMIKAFSMNGMTGHAKELQKELRSM